jgi:zinc D-Ala-D-Ala carboxypeptidase
MRRRGRKAAIRLAMLKDTFSEVDEYKRRVDAIHRLLGVPRSYALRGLPLQREGSVLVPLGDRASGQRHLMTEATRAAFLAMESAAATDGVKLRVRYAYRGLEDQDEMIRELLAARNCKVSDLLSWVAAPGYSEHHTGRALDLATTPEDVPFQDTEGFRWLCRSAAHFGFALSYPPDNPYGLVYEPWHWLHLPD